MATTNRTCELFNPPSLEVLNSIPSREPRGVIPFHPNLTEPAYDCCSTRRNETLNTINDGCIIWCTIPESTWESIRRNNDDLNEAADDYWTRCISGQTLKLVPNNYWHFATGSGEFVEEESISVRREAPGSMLVLFIGFLMVAALMG